MVLASLDDPRFESLLLALHAAFDAATFWSALQSLLQALVPNDACVAYVDYHDFAKTWKVSQIIATPRAQKSPEWLSPREVNMRPAHILSNPGLRSFRLSTAVPDADRLSRTAFFRRYMTAEGEHYTACALFWKDGRLVSEIAVRRTARQGDFTAREMATLDRLRPHIETAMHRVFRPQAGADKFAARIGIDEAGPVGALIRLSPAERALLQLVRQGWSNKEIAAELRKSIRTVKTQLTSVYKKLRVRSRARLLALLAEGHVLSVNDRHRSEKLSC